jgi:hypothetical protein
LQATTTTSSSATAAARQGAAARNGAAPSSLQWFTAGEALNVYFEWTMEEKRREEKRREQGDESRQKGMFEILDNERC